MSRPSHLLLIAMIFTTGALMAAPGFAAIEARVYATGLVAALLVSASIHYANEYRDRETDALTIRTPFSGGSGAMQRYDLDPGLAIGAAWVSVAAGLAVAGWGLVSGNLNVVAMVILVVGAFFGWQYSLGPLELAWRGWGELDNALLGGLALPLYGYAVQAGGVDAGIVVGWLPFTLLVLLNLLETTWPDRAADGAVGKRTLATRLPVSTLRLLFAGIAAAWALVSVGVALFLAPLPATLVLVPAALLVLWATATYTQRARPLPSVAAMVLVATGWFVAELWRVVAAL